MLKVFDSSVETIRFLIRYSLGVQFVDDNDWSSVHWGDVLELSHAHGIDGLVWNEMERLQNRGIVKLSLEDKVDWYGNIRQIQERNKAVEQTLCILSRIFRENEIDWLVLKGVSCSQYYKKVELRPAGDIDIYVLKGRYEFAKQVLRTCEEFVVLGHEDVKHVAMNINGVTVELHKDWELLTDCREYMLVEIKGMNGILSLSREYNVVYVFAHLFRHFIGGSGSLRQLTDWLFMMKADGELDEDSVMEMLRKERLLKAWNAFGWMVKRYFDVEVICLCEKENINDSEGIWDLSSAMPEDTSGGRMDSIPRHVRLLRTYKRHFRAWRLFPNDCLRYFGRLVLNNFKGIVLHLNKMSVIDS